MSETFQELGEYKKTNWYNYNPPSIDQNALLNIENNLELNRNTINEIIKRLGVISESGTSTDIQDIYDTAIYKSLIEIKDTLTELNGDKIDKDLYNSEIGNIENLLGGKNLVEAINNRLRKDQDDISNFGYTFKKLTLTNGLNVTTESILNGATTIKDTLTVEKGITSNGNIQTKSLNVLEDANITNSLTINGQLIAKQGFNATGDSIVNGTLTVDKLVVNGDIECNGNTDIKRYLTCYEATAKRQVTVNCEENGNLWLKKNYMEMGVNAEHRLWVQGNAASLRDGDALILTIS